MPRAIAGTTTLPGFGGGTGAWHGTAPAPGMTESKRLVKLAELEQQAEEAEAWELVKRARAKRDEILDELQRSLDSYFASKVACPLCEPLYLDTLPLSSPRLRNCTRHDLPLLLILGRWQPSESDTNTPGPSSTAIPKSEKTTPSGESSVTSYEFWKLVLTGSLSETPNEKRIRSAYGRDGKEHRRA